MGYTENVHESFSRYFSALSAVGHYPQSGIVGLLIYSFLTDIVFEGPMEQYISDDDLVVFNKVLACLAKNNCLISSPLHSVHLSKPRNNYAENGLRSTQNYESRVTQETDDRITED